MVVAALAYSAISSVRRLRILAISGVVIALLFGITASWLQLRPWHTATEQANDLNQELTRLIPPPPTLRSNVMTWYVENSPRTYEGAYVAHLAVGAARYFIAQKMPVSTK